MICQMLRTPPTGFAKIDDKLIDNERFKALTKKLNPLLWLVFSSTRIRRMFVFSTDRNTDLYPRRFLISSVIVEFHSKTYEFGPIAAGVGAQ